MYLVFTVDLDMPHDVADEISTMKHKSVYNARLSISLGRIGTSVSLFSHEGFLKCLCVLFGIKAMLCIMRWLNVQNKYSISVHDSKGVVLIHNDHIIIMFWVSL